MWSIYMYWYIFSKGTAGGMGCGEGGQPADR